jgi:hypothetical protein
VTDQDYVTDGTKSQWILSGFGDEKGVLTRDGIGNAANQKYF